MNTALRQQIQFVCDEVYRDPGDAAAFNRLQHLLSSEVDDETRGVSQGNWQRLVRLACDELFDAPEDRDAQDRLLFLLAAGKCGPP